MLWRGDGDRGARGVTVAATVTAPNKNAEVAELVDAHDSGSCIRKNVEVRVFSSAPFFNSE